MDYFYNFDQMDNITEKQTGHGVYGYEYDELYRLIDVDNPEAAVTDEFFTYDAVGNRLSDVETTSDWSYNSNNELLDYGDAACSYDDNGNMIQKTVMGQVTNFVYNLKNRLARIENGTGEVIAEYYYDPFGRRLWKEVSGVKTCFYYADEGLVGEYDANGTEIKTYGYKPNSTWTTDPLFMKKDGQYYFYHNDHLGTPQKMTAVNGAVVWSVKCLAFGKPEVDAGPVVENNLMNILTMVTIYSFLGVMLMSTGCATTLHKDYLFHEVQKDLGDIVFHAKLRGKPTKVNNGLTVTGSPYELLIWLSPMSSTDNVEDCEILLDHLALEAVDTENIVFSKMTTTARFSRKADGMYSASFIFKNLDMEYVDYKLQLSLHSPAQCLQNIARKQLEFIFERNYLEKQVSFWDSLMGI